MRKALIGLVAWAALSSGFALTAAAPIKVLVIDGDNNHGAWPETTKLMKKVLEEAGMQVATVTVVCGDADVTPPIRCQGNGSLSRYQGETVHIADFKPKWTDYQVVVLNYNTGINGNLPEWLPETKASFELYLRNGGGLVSVHAADNAFPKWKAFNEMIGIGGWGLRDEKCGPYAYYKDGKLVANDLTPGRGGNHGQRWPFEVVVRNAEHPIVKGLPMRWMHYNDELYNTLRGPGKNMTILATAYSDPSNAGTGRDEPMLMVLDYGKGRIFHTTLGHDVAAEASMDFVVTLQRGTEWAATGKVTQKIPADFPMDATTLSVRLDLMRMDPTYNNGQPAPAGGRGGPGAPGAGRGAPGAAAGVPPGAITPPIIAGATPPAGAGSQGVPAVGAPSALPGGAPVGAPGGAAGGAPGGRGFGGGRGPGTPQPSPCEQMD